MKRFSDLKMLFLPSCDKHLTLVAFIQSYSARQIPLPTTPYLTPPPHTDKKENQVFLIYKEIQNGAVAKSYMRKGFQYMRKCANFFPYMMRPLIYDFATAPF